MERKEELYSYYKSKYSGIVIDDNLIKKYTSVLDEYNYLKNGVGVRALSNYSKIFMHGKDAKSLLERLATNKIDILQKLEWVETLFANFNGNIIDKALILNFEDYFILVGENGEDKLFKWINRFLLNENIAISNSREDYSLFEIIGTQATSYLTMILGDDAEKLRDNNIVRVQLNDFFVYGVRITINSDVVKYILLVDSINAVRTLEILEDNKSVFDFGMVGEDAYNIFRIEKGIPAVPNEINDSVNLIEVNMVSSIGDKKNNFIGAENINRNKNEIDRLVKVRLTKSFANENLPTSIVDDSNNEIGIVTSISNESIVESPIGLGFIGANFSLNGDKYFVTDKNGKYEIKIYEVEK